MRVIADTSVWSLFLRRDRNEKPRSVDLLKQAIREQRIQMLGIIRQEVLSGIRNGKQFKKIKEILDGFPDLQATTDDHIKAAEFFNRCRSNGIQGSPIDF